MNIKRVLAGTLAALTAGATMLFAAAAAPAGLGDYVVTDTNKITSPIIVIGSSAASATEYPKDVVAAADLAAAIAGYATKPVPVAGISAVSVSGGALVATPNRNLYYPDLLSDVKTSFTEDDLSILASGEVEQKGATAVSYMQRIFVGDQQIGFNKNYESEATMPKLNILFSDTENAYTYIVDFTPQLNLTKAAGRTITLLGKEYVFDSNPANLKADSFVIFGAGKQELKMAPGEEKTVTIEGKSHTIKLLGVASADYCSGNVRCATLVIDGEEEGVDEGEVITIDSTDVWVKRIDVFTYPSEGYITLSMGAEKLTFVSGTGIQKAGETIKGTEGLTVTGTGDVITRIELPYMPEEDTYITEGGSMSDGVFNAFKISFGTIVPGFTDASRDKIVLKRDGSTKIKMQLTNSLGMKYTIPVVYYDTSGDVLSLGESASKPLVINEAIVLEKDYYFGLSAGQDTFFAQVVGFDSSKETVKVKELATGKTIEVKCEAGGGGYYITIGGHDFAIADCDVTAKTVEIDLTDDASGIAQIYTKSGALIDVSNIDGTSDDGVISITEPDYIVNGAPTSVTLDVEINSDTTTDKITDVDVTGISLEQKEDSDYYYGITDVGTYVVNGKGDIDTAELYIPVNMPALFTVAFGPDPKFTAAGIETAVKIQQPVAKLDNEVGLDAGVDLILVGGPCANKLVASLMGVAAGEDCLAKFTTAVAACGGSKELIKEYTLANGKKALVVAGLNADDTRAAAARAMKNDFTCK
ncbi:MAG: hypothetical protein QXP39_02815 [Candidatus Aenigmatarchaeota archaeon]